MEKRDDESRFVAQSGDLVRIDIAGLTNDEIKEKLAKDKDLLAAFLKEEDIDEENLREENPPCKK